MRSFGAADLIAARQSMRCPEALVEATVDARLPRGSSEEVPSPPPPESSALRFMPDSSMGHALGVSRVSYCACRGCLLC